MTKYKYPLPTDSPSSSDALDHVPSAYSHLARPSNTYFRTQYDPSLTEEGYGLSCPPEEGMTSSEFADDCDINTIMAKYEKTGQLPQLQDRAMQYGDFSQIPDFQTMRNKVIAAEEMFAELPAKVRAHFQNDPGLFIAAAETPEGIESLKALGLGEVANALPSAASRASSLPLDDSLPASGVQPDLEQDANQPSVSKSKKGK